MVKNKEPETEDMERILEGLTKEERKFELSDDVNEIFPK